MMSWSYKLSLSKYFTVGQNRKILKKKQEEERNLRFNNKEKSEQRRLKRLELIEKQKLCFNCRQVGHKMSNCPLEKTNKSTGICFKCGSNEHALRHCTLTLDDDNHLPYATCFICSQSGHISRDCFQNDKGLYPNGGCCNLCWSVKHLKQDCPKNKKKKGERNQEKKPIFLKLLNDDNVSVDEDLTPDLQGDSKPVAKKKVKKVVKF